MAVKTRLLAIVLFIFVLIAFTEAKYTPEEIQEFKALVQTRLDKYKEGSCTRVIHDYFQTIYGDFQQQMWLQSLHGINDVSGDQMAICQQLKTNMTVPEGDLSWDTSYSVISLNVSSMPVKIRFGVCLPSSCTQEDLFQLGNKTSIALSAALKAILDSKYNPQIQFIPDWTQAEIQVVKSSEFDSDYWLNAPYLKYGLIIVSLVLSLIFFIILYASLIKLINDQHGNTTQKRLVNISFQKSFHDLFSQRKVDTSIFADKQDLQMFDFFRVICLIWILAFGTAQFTMSGSAYNPWTLQDYFKTIAYTLVYSANFGFDEFFLLSSFFAYIRITAWLKYSHPRGVPGEMNEVDYIGLIGHRFLRLMPVYYAVFLFGWLVGPYLNTGPWWFTYQMGFCDCQHYWWSVFTMTINFFPGYVVANEGCFYWGWFTACEMQLFVVIPILVYLLEFKLRGYKAAQMIVIFAVLALGTALSYHILYENNMAAGLFAPQDVAIYKLWLNKPYTKLHCVALGMFMGQLYLSVNQAKKDGSFEEYKRKSVFSSGWVALIACFLSLGLLGFLSTYPRSANNDPASWSRQKSAVFVSLSRPAFLLGLICLFYLLWLDHAQGMKRFCSRQIWAIPARLSYSVYLVFPITSAQFNSSMNSALYLTYNEMFFQLIFNMLCAFLAAMIAYVLIEAPVRNLMSGDTEGVKPMNIASEEKQIDASILKMRNLESFLKQQQLNVQATPTPDPSDYYSTMIRDSQASSYARGITITESGPNTRDQSKIENSLSVDLKY